MQSDSEISRTATEPCEHPVFVLGCFRSGTSGLAWALAEHPELWTSGESHFLHHLLGEGKLRAAFEASLGPAGNWFAEQEVKYEELCQNLGRGWNALLTSRSGGKRWVEQTPSYTAFAEDLAHMFPESRFLYIERDPRYVVNSMIHFERVAEDSEREKQRMGWGDFRNACRTWRYYCEKGRHFAERHPDRCSSLTLEDLSASPEGEFERIQRFLGLEAHEGSARFFASKRINSSFGSDGPPPNPWETWCDEQRAIFREELPDAVSL